MSKKKQNVYGGGGGAWKVAYADFVTAMMALFMVLWISAQSEEILISTAYYFQNPFISPLDSSTGLMESRGNGLNDTEVVQNAQDAVVDKSFLTALANEFYKLFNMDVDAQDGPVKIEILNNELKIVIFNRTDQPIFEKGKSELTEWAKFSLGNLAWLIDRHDLKVKLDSHESIHTEKPAEKESTVKVTQGNQLYESAEKERDSKWLLSSKRGITVADYLVKKGLSENKIYSITSYSDNVPKDGVSAESDQNDRIEISLRPKYE